MFSDSVKPVTSIHTNHKEIVHEHSFVEKE